jgi:hypothetical protein
MAREITDKEGIVWSCIQAYAGLSQDGDEKNDDAARVEGKEDLVYVVCTPTGGAQTVRLELKTDWEDSVSDEDLSAKIEENLKS